ncbi:MAG: nitrilase-related carbon-nitrogen hydrolase [Solirubrobacterales bacterium]
MTEPPSAPTSLACLQFEPEFGAVEANLAKLALAAAEAVERGAEIVVAPELCTTGYVFATREEAMELADRPGSGGGVDALIELAARHSIHLVAGFAERVGSRCYNSCLLSGPDGLLGIYRKVHLWDREALFFEPGDVGLPIFDLPQGRIACMICYDAWFPELWRAAALGGADLVCLPTNWVPIPGQDPERGPMANLLCMTAAHQNGLWVAAADRVGVERGQPFIGSSLITAPTGWPVAGPAATDREEILVGGADLGLARGCRSWGKFNHVLRDRRPEVYAMSTRTALAEEAA